MKQDVSDAHNHLLDREVIAGLIHAYCFHFDRNKPDAVAALFAPDAIVDYGPETTDLIGVPAVRTAAAAGLANLFAATSHHVSNVIVRFAKPDTATSICCLYA